MQRKLISVASNFRDSLTRKITIAESGGGVGMNPLRKALNNNLGHQLIINGDNGEEEDLKRRKARKSSLDLRKSSLMSQISLRRAKSTIRKISAFAMSSEKRAAIPGKTDCSGGKEKSKHLHNIK
jgi:hypothetical protein